MKTTQQHSKYWAERKIDWNAHYLSTWNMPHRTFFTSVLNTFSWFSLMEVGCGPGANLVNITKYLGSRQLGGVDINPDAIELAQQTFKGGFFKVCPINDIMMSDKSTDVVTSDMSLIYIGPTKITQALKEIKRITRTHVVFSEFHSESWWERLKLRWRTGYNAYDYKKRLSDLGFYNIQLIKIPANIAPGDESNRKYRYIIKAKRPKR